MIYEFKDMKTAVQQAQEIPDPKQIWVDINRVVVRTGPDIQTDPDGIKK